MNKKCGVRYEGDVISGDRYIPLRDGVDVILKTVQPQRDLKIQDLAAFEQQMPNVPGMDISYLVVVDMLIKMESSIVYQSEEKILYCTELDTI